MIETDKRHLELMITKIDEYENDKISFNNLIEKLWGLYEIISDEMKNDYFIDLFHKHWDYLEEIRATKREEEYKDIILNKILVELKTVLKGYL